MKQEYLQPVWNYNTHEDPLTNIHNLHLILWSKGLCIAGYDIACTVLSIKVFTFEKTWDTDLIESIFINEPLVAGPQPVTHIWIADERNFLIPDALFNAETAPEWLQQFHFVEATESVLYSTIEQPVMAQTAFPVNNKLGAIFNKYFQEAKVNSITAPALHIAVQPDRKYYADIICLSKTMILTIFNKGQLINHQVTAYDAVEDIIYKTASIITGLGAGPDEVSVHLSGYAAAITEMGKELQHYFPNTLVPGSEADASFLFLNRLLSCAS
jgi:hypothetical protein